MKALINISDKNVRELGLSDIDLMIVP